MFNEEAARPALHLRLRRGRLVTHLYATTFVSLPFEAFENSPPCSDIPVESSRQRHRKHTTVRLQQLTCLARPASSPPDSGTPAQALEGHFQLICNVDAQHAPCTFGISLKTLYITEKSLSLPVLHASGTALNVGHATRVSTPDVTQLQPALSPGQLRLVTREHASQRHS